MHISLHFRVTTISVHGMLKLLYIISQVCMMSVHCLGVGATGWDLYNVWEGVALRSSTGASIVESAGSSGHCSSLCSRIPHCSAANYRSGRCEIFTEPPLPDTHTLPGNLAIVKNPCLSNPCKNGGTCTFDVTGVYACTCMGNFRGINCQTLYELSLRVDDEGAVYSKGQLLHDTFSMPGEQWWITYKIQLNTDVLVLKTWNNGWPGGVTASADDVTVTGWRCLTFGKDQDPETEYPGSTYPDYDDSAWTDPLATDPPDTFGQLCRAKLS